MLSLNNPSLLKTACLINHQWVQGQSQQSFAVVNPFNQDVLGHVPSLTADDVRQAIAVAKKAQPLWANKTASERGKILHQWADLIEQNLADLAKIMTAEQGKPIKEAQGEIHYANSFIRWFAEEGKRIYGDVIPAPHKDLRYLVLKQPIGVCAAITPWNFPSAMITRKVAPALAAGCCMIVKPASQTPFSALALGELAIQAGIPAGVLQIVTGKADVIGDVLTEDERIEKLSFTGSTEIGRQLMAKSANNIKKLSLELGGNAPFIVFDDADIQRAVQGLMASKFRNAGQTCICANRIYVHKNIKDEFLKQLIAEVQQLTVGDGMNPQTEIGALINQTAVDKIRQLLQNALDKGATLLTGGKPHPVAKLCFTPTILTDITDDMAIAHEEIFGPIIPVLTFEHEDEVIAHANDTIYGLAAYFYTQNLSRSWRVAEKLQYGMVAQNTGILSSEVAPFGGIKQSGFGREGSKYGIDEYTIIKYWSINIK